jgi:hypothetical protein
MRVVTMVSQQTKNIRRGSFATTNNRGSNGNFIK